LGKNIEEEEQYSVYHTPMAFKASFSTEQIINQEEKATGPFHLFFGHFKEQNFHLQSCCVKKELDGGHMQSPFNLLKFGTFGRHIYVHTVNNLKGQQHEIFEAWFFS